jgi:hypothetical protein
LRRPGGLPERGVSPSLCVAETIPVVEEATSQGDPSADMVPVAGLQARVAALEEALRPFAALADEADGLGHKSGSSCPWRIAYDDLARARSVLAKHGVTK